MAHRYKYCLQMEIMFSSNNWRLPSHILRVKPLKAFPFVFSKNTVKNKNNGVYVD